MASGARDQERALEDVLYEMLMLASALAFRDIRILGSAESRMGLSTDRPGRYPPQVAPPVEFFRQSKSKGTVMIAADFSHVQRQTNARARADRPTMKRLRRTLDAIHQDTVHLSWNRLNRPNPNKADRQQMEKDAEFLLAKTIEFALFGNVNRLHQLLLGTARTVEGVAGRPDRSQKSASPNPVGSIR